MQTQTSEKLAALNIVVDKFHFKGHIDKWCHENCNPYSFEDLENVCYTIELAHKLYMIVYMHLAHQSFNWIPYCLAWPHILIWAHHYVIEHAQYLSGPDFGSLQMGQAPSHT